jgi:hypothetical protein
MLQNWIFVVSLCCFVMLFILVVFLQTVIKLRLKKCHANNGGTPDVTFNPLDHSARRTLLFFKFLVKRQYTNIDDSRLILYCNTLLVLYLLYIASFVWITLSIFI